MATWQFDIKILPTQGVLRRYGTIPVVIPKEQLSSEELWKDIPLPQDMESEFSKILPRAKSWSEKLKIWGDDEGDRIDLWSHDGESASGIYVRIDVREISHAFLAKILNCARQYHWLIRTEDGRLFQPSFAKLLSAIRSSNAFRFVENPQLFLESLAKAQKNEPNNDDSDP